VLEKCENGLKKKTHWRKDNGKEAKTVVLAIDQHVYGRFLKLGDSYEGGCRFWISILVEGDRW